MSIVAPLAQLHTCIFHISGLLFADTCNVCSQTVYEIVLFYTYYGYTDQLMLYTSGQAVQPKPVRSTRAAPNTSGDTPTVTARKSVTSQRVLAPPITTQPEQQTETTSDPLTNQWRVLSPLLVSDQFVYPRHINSS